MGCTKDTANGTMNEEWGVWGKENTKLSLKMNL